jgi:DNA-binding NarL/FixJ family response regulator
MSEIMLVGLFPNCLRVKEEVLAYEPDVVLMDIDMPRTNGIDGVRIIKEMAPHTYVLMHTVFDDDDKIFNSLAAGADGYLLKTSTPMELYTAIKDVSTGGAPMSPGVAKKVLETFRRNNRPESDITELSERENEILLMLTRGYTYKRISAECSISIDTTRTHIKNIYSKLHVNCNTEAVAKAMRLKLLNHKL